MTLADVAPRLALARDQRRQELRRESLARRRMIWRLLEAERLVAHRELQLARAQTYGRRAYIIRREQKLADGRRLLAETRRRAADLGVDT